MIKALFSYLTIVLIVLLSGYAHANINAIYLSRIPSSQSINKELTFLKENCQLYDHWVHDWNYSVPKDTVVARLTFIYNKLTPILNKNEETYLLLGDVAHYLYNLELEPYYEKALTNYKAAITSASSDYRAYWFLANHYSLAAQPSLAIATYNIAFRNLTQKPDENLWVDYSIACTNAGMLGTAQFAAHQLSLVQGKKSHLEEQITTVAAHQLKTPPADTTIVAKDLWGSYGKNGEKLQVINWLNGIKFKVDSLWELQLGDYKNKTTFATFKPLSITAKNGKKIDYSILLLAKVADNGETLQQFLDKFSTKSKNKKPYVFEFGKKTENSISIEATDPDIYPNIGGSHFYTIVFERNPPEFAGMKIEEPITMPTNGGGMAYYTMNAKYKHLPKKIYYLVMLDTCGFINNESLSVFNDFLSTFVVE